MKFNHKKGFSLAETIVYIAIVAIIFTVIVNSVIAISSSSQKMQLARNIENSAVASFERMSREIRNAKSVNFTQSVLGANAGRLVLDTIDASGNSVTLDFYLENGIIKIKENGIVVGPITYSNATVEKLIFRRVDTKNSQGIKIEETVRSGSRVENFYSTIGIRGTY